jgi:uncharacterized protein
MKVILKQEGSLTFQHFLLSVNKQMILEKILQHLRDNYQSYLSDLTIADLRVGLYMAAVQLSDGAIGIASAETDPEIICAKHLRDYGEFTPLKIQGRKVIELLESPKKSALVRTLKIAVLNAVSTRIIERNNYKVIRNTDPIDLLDLSGQKTITMVGAFQSYIKKISETKNKLSVLEFNENALLAEHRHYYVPAVKFTEILPVSDIVIITGLTLVNETIDNLLAHCRPDSRIVITGPSSSMIPDIFFKQNVSILGGIRINKPEQVFPLISQGATGYHLFEYCAEKICILNEKQQ